MRITRKIFLDLAIYMVGFGILVGLIFPYFVMLFNVPKHIARSPIFLGSCILAGILVGLVNIFFVRIAILSRIKIMSAKMISIEQNLRNTILTSSHNIFDIDSSKITIDSEDEIGRNAATYNHLVETLSLTIYSEELNGDLSIDSIADKGLSKLMHITKASAGCILIHTGSDLSIVKNVGIKDAEHFEDNELIRQVFDSAKGLVLTLPTDIVASVILVEFIPKEVIIEPIVYDNHPLGIIVLATATSFDPDMKSRIAILNTNLSRAINNAIAHDQVKKLAASDYLTEVYNKRFGMIRLQEELDISKRTKQPLCTVMFDLDHFKEVNDIHGHLAGDKVLVTVARIAQSEIRSSDTLLRFGGEEFLIVLRNTTSDEAYQLAERLRLKIERQSILYNGKHIDITSSFGVSCSTDLLFDDIESILSSVDKALYQSKRGGRNRTTRAQEK